MTTLLPSPQRNAISDERDQKSPRSVCGFNAQTTQPRRHRAGQQHEHCRGHRPGRRGRLQKSREFPWWLLPVVGDSRGKFSRGDRSPVQKIPWVPVVVSSRGKGFRGGQFPSKTPREFPWWLNPAGKVPKIKNRTRGRPSYLATPGR